MATGGEVPKTGDDNNYYLNEHCDVKPILESEYGLSSFDALSLALTGDGACENANGRLAPSEITNWPEAEIVQALLDKVDELEAQEATSD